MYPTFGPAVTPRLSVGKDQVADSALEPLASSHLESKMYDVLLGTHRESAELFSSTGKEASAGK